MKNIFVLLVIFLFNNSFLHSQNKISLNIGPGYYITNSENDMKIIGGKRFKFFPQYGISFQRENLLGLNMMLEYNFQSNTKADVIEFVIQTSPDGGRDYTSESFFGDLSLIHHTLDIDYIGNITECFAFGFGPSFTIINRIFELDKIHLAVGEQTGEVHLYDKLASSGIGVNGFLMFNVPLTHDNKFFFTSKIKFRYTHSIWFDEGLRKLDNYYQEFLTSQISLGIGYSF